MKTIEIVVSLKGDTTVRTKGFVGNECRRASKFVEKALGSRANERLTAEFYQEVGQQQVARHSE